ncbi:MAG: hypothetical protein WCH63_08090 [Actinomycetota bacterium]
MSANAKNSRAAVEQRNLIVPQMVDYDELGARQEWVPHLMYFHPRSVELKSVSTNEYGIRKTVGAKDESPTALLIGSSAVFGVGATSDATTIPSRLNKLTKLNWLNFGGRAFNSTQEVLLVQLANIKKVAGPLVMLSGVNNLTRALMPGSYSSMYGAFFQQSLFEKQMAVAAVGNRELSRMLFAGVRAKFGLAKKTTAAAQSRSSKADSYAAMLSVFERDCEYLQMVAKNTGTTSSFVLQPFAPWLNKTLTTEEKQLFALLDQEAESFSQVLNELAEYRDQYIKDLHAICSKVGVKYLNLNDAPELQQPDWLFADRVHLTDSGYDAVARLLVRDLAL